MTPAKTLRGTPRNFFWNTGKFFLELADLFCGSGSKNASRYIVDITTQKTGSKTLPTTEDGNKMIKA